MDTEIRELFVTFLYLIGSLVLVAVVIAKAIRCVAAGRVGAVEEEERVWFGDQLEEEGYF